MKGIWELWFYIDCQFSPKPHLWPKISSNSIDFTAWRSNYINNNLWYVINHPCPNTIAKTPLKLGYGQFIIYHIYLWDMIDLIHKSQNTPVPYPTMLHPEQKCAHFCSGWSIVGYGTGAFWELWNLVILCPCPNPSQIQGPGVDVDGGLVKVSRGCLVNGTDCSFRLKVKSC